MVHVVSILAPTLEGLRAEAERQAPLADLVELRLDAVPETDEEALAELFKAVGKPVIVALHGPEAFGTFAGSVEERLEILQRAARAGARFVEEVLSFMDSVDGTVSRRAVMASGSMMPAGRL